MEITNDIEENAIVVEEGYSFYDETNGSSCRSMHRKRDRASVEGDKKQQENMSTGTALTVTSIIDYYEYCCTTNFVTHTLCVHLLLFLFNANCM